MNGSDQQELREFVRLKHHSHELKRHHLAQSSLFRDQGVGGSNPLAPTNLLKSMGYRRFLEITWGFDPTHWRTPCYLSSSSSFVSVNTFTTSPQRRSLGT